VKCVAYQEAAWQPRLLLSCLVTRDITVAVPVRVDYALTPLGRGLMPAVIALKDWAQEHIGEIEAARSAFDEQVTGQGIPRAPTPPT
jgi:DNA-binding HxlR family transcriptional regulator